MIDRNSGLPETKAMRFSPQVPVLSTESAKALTLWVAVASSLTALSDIDWAVMVDEQHASCQSIVKVRKVVFVLAASLIVPCTV